MEASHYRSRTQSFIGVSNKNESVNSSENEDDGEIHLKKAPIFDTAKRIFFEQEKEILTKLQNIAIQLSPERAKTNLKLKKTLKK